MRRGAVLAGAAFVALLLVSAPASACDACYGAAADSPMIDGAKIGVFLLLGVTVSVQGGFVAFFVYLRRRARRAVNEEIEAEWGDLQRRSEA